MNNFHLGHITQHLKQTTLIAMDIPPLNISNSKSSSSEPDLKQLQALLDIRSFKPGAKFIAQVEAIQKLSDTQRQTLFDYLGQAKPGQPRSAQEQPANSSPNTIASNQLGTAEPNKLLGLLASRDVFLVQLKIRGKLLSTLTSVPLTLQQKIDVQVRPDGQLQLQLKPAQTTQQGTERQIPIQDTAKPLSSGINNIQEKRWQQLLQDPAQVNKAMNIVVDGLRQYLPKAQPLAQNFNQLQSVLKDLQTIDLRNLPQPTQQSAQQLIQHLQRLVDRAVPIQTLQQPQGVQRALSQAGYSLEAKLQTAADRIRQANHRALLNADGRSPLPSRVAAESNARSIVRDLAIPSDLKTTLLQSLALLPRTDPNTPKTDSQNAIIKLLQAVFPQATTPGKTASNMFDATQSKLVSNALLSSLARITSLQLRHLISALHDQQPNNTGGMLELPVRIGDTIYPMVIQIQERWSRDKDAENEKEKRDKKKNKTVSRWHVYLEFDLDEFGKFASDISLQGHSVKTKFWIQQKRLWETSKRHLSELQTTLEHAGIVVEEIQCYEGEPPAKSMDIRQSLVDIQT